jgi:hypothetical protein
MTKFFKNEDFKISLIFGLIGLVASAIVGWYQVSTFSPTMIDQIIAQVGSVEAMVVIAAVQGAIMTLIASFFGLKIARKVNLALNFKCDLQAFIIALLVGIVVAVIIVGSDRFIFVNYLPPVLTKYQISWQYLLSGVLYGGIIEEVLLRLFVMSLLVLVIWKLTTLSIGKHELTDWMYHVAIFLAALLFAAGHLPTTFQLLGNSTIIIIRCFVLNGVGGIGFGYLYWKKGLSYAMVAHMATHIMMQLVLYPLLLG